jgi:DNA-binding CsgD family transcriptional regulator
MAGIRFSLTLKEIDLCRMIKGGLTSKEVAQALGVSVQTVEKQRKGIRRKLGITNKAVDLGTFLNKL